MDNVVIGKNVKIGANCQIGSFVVIHDDTNIGDNVIISDFCVLGRKPMRAKRSVTTIDSELEPTKIGNNVLLGTSAIIYRGATIGDSVLVADHAQVRERSSIGSETIVGRLVTVENDCSVGSRVKLETGAYITAKSEIGDYCFVAPMVAFTNDPCAGRDKRRFDKIKGATLKRGARVGANATLLPGVILHEDCLVAAGSVVTKDVEAKTIVKGSPSKYFRNVPDEQLVDNQ